MNVDITTASITDYKGELLALGVPEDGLDTALAELPEALATHLRDAAAVDEFTGKAGQCVIYPSLGHLAVPRLALVGLGGGSTDEVRRAAGQAGTSARGRGQTVVGLSLGTLDAAATIAAVEGFCAGNYRFDRFKADKERKPAAESLELLGHADAEAARKARGYAAGQSLARDLVNLPAADLYPESLAAVALELAGDGLTVDVWDEKRIAEAGMGGIIAVGQGSDRPPRFVHMVWKPEGTPKARVCLVGKGVTFDSGGYSLKPTTGMLTMRCDMGGAAAVVGTMRSVKELAPQVEVHAIFGAVENLVNGTAYKLGDVLKMYSGKTVEVHNTDAEGRLVLADCLAYASKLGVDAIIDLATLTGAAVVALGPHYTALYSDDDALVGALECAAAGAGENVWRMPLPQHYKEMLKADWGSIKNVGGREGGSITAALFLSEFVEGTAWAHCDIAGPAFFDKPWRHFVKGGSGAMVPTLVRWIVER